MIPEIAIHKRSICKNGSREFWLNSLSNGTLDNIAIAYQQIPQISVISRLPNVIALSARIHYEHISWNASRPKTLRDNVIAGYIADSATVSACALLDFSCGVGLHLFSLSCTKE